MLHDVRIAASAIHDVLVCRGFFFGRCLKARKLRTERKALFGGGLVVSEVVEGAVVECDVVVSSIAVAPVGRELGVPGAIQRVHPNCYSAFCFYT